MNIATVEDAWLGATHQFDKWKAEFEAEFSAPADETEIALGMRELIGALPPEVLAEMERMNPQAFGEVMGKYVGGTGDRGLRTDDRGRRMEV
uniref:Uncharacterized protein n=1 Tax=viral metagenome TaxID=1070528 RepID=A0A6M3KTL5_9ZZZZ